ncbi:EutN/CcmL family microcompartment protein [Myxococcota bacterium]|nr:EutN/CcmL family microcompartment protein [Myxococcota bacterium]
MLLARVIGTVVATQKEEVLDGLKFLLLQATNPDASLRDTFVVAVDSVGAGLGDLVLYVSGSSARQTTVTNNRPVDATVMAIVDLVEEQGEFAYRKDSE